MKKMGWVPWGCLGLGQWGAGTPLHTAAAC